MSGGVYGPPAPKRGLHAVTFSQLGALVLLLWFGFTAAAVVVGIAFAIGKVLYILAAKQVAFIWWLVRPW